MLPPTSTLPPIKFIAAHTTESLHQALRYLRTIYNPPVRGSRRRNAKANALESDSINVADVLRTDAFERAYAIKWLTALVAQCEIADESQGSDDEAARRETLVEDAASLLATCAGTASAGVITRQFVFDVDAASSTPPVPESPREPIVIELTDVPLDNHDYGSVGAQTWGGACVMAEMIVEDPQAFGLPWPSPPSQDERGPQERPMRCLELGAGTGLVSLTIGKLIERIVADDTRTVDVVATDYYPSVLGNLEHNIQSNFRAPRPTHSRVGIVLCRLDWSTFSDVEIHEPAFAEPFDVVYGADIIYEALHATWIKQCLVKLLRKPSSSADSDDPLFHLIIPLRATHAVESGTIEKVFRHVSAANTSAEALELVIKHKEIIVCDVDGGDSDKEGEEVNYAYYKIGWGCPQP